MRLSDSLAALADGLPNELHEVRGQLRQLAGQAPRTEHWTSTYAELTPSCTHVADVDVLASVSLSDGCVGGLDEVQAAAVGDEPLKALLGAATSSVVDCTHVWFEFDSPAQHGFLQRSPSVLVPLSTAIDSRGFRRPEPRTSALERARHCCTRLGPPWPQMLTAMFEWLPTQLVVRNASFMLARLPRLLKLNFECHAHSLAECWGREAYLERLLRGSRLASALDSRAGLARFQIGVDDALALSSLEIEAHAKPSGHGLDWLHTLATACPDLVAPDLLDAAARWPARSARGERGTYTRFVDTKLRLASDGTERWKVYFGLMERPFPF